MEIKTFIMRKRVSMLQLKKVEKKKSSAQLKQLKKAANESTLQWWWRSRAKHGNCRRLHHNTSLHEPIGDSSQSEGVDVHNRSPVASLPYSASEKRTKYIFYAIFIFSCFTRKSVIVRATNSKHGAPGKKVSRTASDIETNPQSCA